MKTKSKIRGFILRSAAAATLLFSFALVALSFSGKTASSSSQTKTLTFAERVAYQRAIEEVYWRHRIWPKENRQVKPSLDAVMSQTQIEKKVEDYLRDSQLVGDYWQRPIIPEQLQTEMERMAQHTKQPEILRELFAALGDNPFVIAECLARPALADRLLSDRSSTGGRIDRPPVRRAEAELLPHARVVGPEEEPLQSQAARADNEVPTAIATASGEYILPKIPHVAACINNSWTATNLTNAPSGRNQHTAVWTGTEMIV
jgi:hypothetical protein